MVNLKNKKIDANTSEEIFKCTTNPYYFATKYLTITGSDGVVHPYTTLLTEEEYNKLFYNQPIS